MGPYLRIPFTWLDLGVPSVLGHVTWNVFTVQRRYIWRKEDPFYSTLGKLIAEKRVISRASVSDLMEATQYGERTVRRSLAELSQLGWSKRQYSGSKILMYELGYLTKRGERLHAEDWIDQLEVAALEHFRKELDDRVRLQDVDFKLRLAFAREWKELRTKGEDEDSAVTTR